MLIAFMCVYRIMMLMKQNKKNVILLCVRSDEKKQIFLIYF